MENSRFVSFEYKVIYYEVKGGNIGIIGCFIYFIGYWVYVFCIDFAEVFIVCFYVMNWYCWFEYWSWDV